jgi:hypothetical protein
MQYTGVQGYIQRDDKLAAFFFILTNQFRRKPRELAPWESFFGKNFPGNKFPGLPQRRDAEFYSFL